MRQELTATRVELALAHREIAALRHHAQEVRIRHDWLAEAGISTEPDFADEVDLLPVELERGRRYRLDPPTREALLDRERLFRRGYPIVVMHDETQIGYRLALVHSNSVLFRLGLRSGDLIRAIEGHALASQHETVAALLLAADSPRVRLTVQRSGRLRSLIWELDTDLSPGGPLP